jgi:hypothetical protein
MNNVLTPTVWRRLLSARTTLVAVVAAAASAGALGAVASPAVAADACPNAAIRAQQGTADLPDCRAYEMVSPAGKNGYSIYRGAGLTRLSRDGDTAVYTSFGTFAGATDGLPQTYRAMRSPDGWTTAVASPKLVAPFGDVPSGIVNLWDPSTPDLRTGVVVTQDNLVSDIAPLTLGIYTSTADGTPTLASRAADGTPAPAGSSSFFAGISNDGSRVFFGSNANLVNGDTDRLDGSDVYERVAGTTRLLNQRPDGTLISTCGSVLGGTNIFTPIQTRRNAISQDGKQAIFSVPSGVFSFSPDCLAPTRIFMQSFDQGLVEISASEAAVADTPQNAHYQGAAADGSRIIFSSSAKLVDGAPSGGLYMYTVDKPLGSRLRLLVPTSNLRVVKVSDDGRSVYFTSVTALAPGATDGTTGLYVYRDGSPSGSLTWIADDPGDQFLQINANEETSRAARISPDGNVLSFLSDQPLTGFDNTDPRTGLATFQVFVYQYGQGLRCVSCDVAGQRPADAPVSGNAAVGAGYNFEPNPQRISDDNSRVFFESPDRLVAGDANSVRDVYEYAGGRVHLISTGHGSSDVSLADVSASGDTVMFSTTESILPQDTDGGDKDVYVARVDGGFPGPSRPAPPCDGDGCQGPARPQVTPDAVGSVSFAGPGDASQGLEHTASPTVSKVATVRGTSTWIRVKVPGMGTIGVSGSGLTRSSKAVTKAGTYRVMVRLSALARQTLARKHRLSARVSVRFTPAKGKAQTVRVNVSFASKAKTPTSKRSTRRATVPSSGIRNGR